MEDLFDKPAESEFSPLMVLVALDLILIAFFAAMLNMSRTDYTKSTRIMESLSKTFGTKAEITYSPPKFTPPEPGAALLKELFVAHGLEVPAESANSRINMRIPPSFLFYADEAAIKPQATLFSEKLADIIADYNKHILVTMPGDFPPHLAAARAATLADIMKEAGIYTGDLKVGYSGKVSEIQIELYDD